MLGSINLIDIFLPLILFGGVYLCFRRGFLPTLVSIFTLFVAFTVAALLYNPFINWFSQVIGKSNSGQDAGSIVFAGLTLALFAFLEWMIRRNYPNLRIESWGNANHVLGGVVGVIWTALALSLILLVIEYATLTFGGAQSSPEVHSFSGLLRQSNLVGLFRQFFNLPLSLIRPLFPTGLPDVLSHFVY